jgi:hypothetical protein
MKLNTLLFSTLVIGLSLSSCKKENQDGSIRYQMKATNPTASFRKATTGTTTSARLNGALTWNAGFVNATEIKFEAKNNSNEIEYKSKTQQRLDLFSSISALGSITLPPGSYKEVEFKIEIAPRTSEPALQLSGTYNGTPVILKVDNTFEFKAEKEGVDITENNGYTAVNNLDLALLTQGITDADLSNAVQTNGQIIISTTSNSSLFAKLSKSLGACESEFEKD